MTQDEYIKELRRLYEMAVKQGTVTVALDLLNRIKEKSK